MSSTEAAESGAPESRARTREGDASPAPQQPESSFPDSGSSKTVAEAPQTPCDHPSNESDAQLPHVSAPAIEPKVHVFTPWSDLAKAPHILGGIALMTVINLKHSSDEYLNLTYSGPMDHLEIGDPKRGKYAGWITVPPYGRPLINTEPCFDSAEDAMDHMRKIVAACRAYGPLG